MRDLDDQIRRYLDATAPAVDVESGVSTIAEDETVIALAEHPRQRGRWVRTLAVAASIAILAVGIAGIFAIRDDPAATIESDGSATTVDAGADETAPEPSARPSGERGEGLEWVRGAVPNGSPLEFVQLLSDGKRFYWVGDRIYTSLDGTTWEVVDFDGGMPTRLLDGRRAEAVWAGQLIQSEPFPSLGSTSGEPAVSVEIVGIDGSVRSSTLSPAENATGPTVVAEIQQSQATIGTRGAVVVARLSVQDYQPLLADVLGAEAESVVSVRLDRQGASETLQVELRDRTERIVLVDQGVNTSDFEVLPTGPIAWHSPDGVTWTPILARGPFAPGVDASTFATGTASGFFAVARSNSFSTAGSGWFSADGLSWSELDGDLPCCEVATPWGTRALITTTDGDDFLAADADGITTLTGSGAETLTQQAHRSLGAGEAGVAYLVDLDPPVDPTFDIVYSPDGASWQRQPLPDLIGDLYCCFLDNYGVVVGAESVAVLSAAESGLELWLGTPLAAEAS